MKAIIPAAGLGTRFLPATKSMPKELLPVLDKPVIQYVVEEALEPEGVDGVIIVNSREKPQIEDYFSIDEKLEDMLSSRGKDEFAQRVHEASTLPVSFVYQDNPRGLGHAVLCAAEAVGAEPFFVLLGDYFVPDRQMCLRMTEVSKEHGGASVIAVAPVPEDQTNRYGIIAGECINRSETADTESEGAVWKVWRSPSLKTRHRTSLSSADIFCLPESWNFSPRKVPAPEMRYSLLTRWSACLLKKRCTRWW